MEKMRAGQAMLVTVLSLGGAILGATTIAGLLMLYQIRATTDTVNSTKAIFAADAGIEWARFNFYCANEGRCPSGKVPVPALDESGAAVMANCYSDLAATTPSDCSDASTTVAVISTGLALSSERAFYYQFSKNAPVYP